MGRIRTIVPIAMAATFALSGAAQADSYDTVNPDGSVTRTQLTADGQTKSATIVSPPTRQTQAEIIQRMAESAAYGGIAAQPREYLGASAFGRDRDRDRDRDKDRDRDRKHRPQYYPYYPYPYPLPGNYYPAYPYSYQLPGPNGSGAWITSVPGNNGYVYPGWGYPTNPGYPVNQGYPYNYSYNYPNGYPVGGFPGYPSYSYPYPGNVYSYPPYGYGSYGSGNYSGRSSTTYGGLTIGKGGVGVRIGGSTTSSEHSTTTR